MSRMVYLNDAYLPEAEAHLPIFDRGLLFADAVYEGLGVLDGQIVDFLHHMARLRRSLNELKFAEPLSTDEIFAILMRLIAENNIDEGFLYFHITRGAHDRDYLFPTGLRPNVFAFTQPLNGPPADAAPTPVRLHSSPDLRWARRDVKTSNLLGQVLAKDVARNAGADEALMVDPDGFVTEGGCTSFFMLKGGTIFARPLMQELLPGVTRRTMLAVAAENDIEIRETKFTLEDVFDADEAFLTGASSYIEPVGALNGRLIGDGQAGPFTRKLREAYLKAIRATFYTPAS